MTTHIHTKIWEIRQSSKGWSGIWGLCFSKEKALQKCEQLNEEAKAYPHKTNYRVYEHTAVDVLTYTTED